MPFRFGKGDKKNEETPDEPAGLSESDVGDPVDEPAEDPEETPEGEPDAGEAEDSAAETASDEEPAPPPALVRPQFRPDYLEENGRPSRHESRRSAEERAAPEPSEQAIFVVVRDDQGNAVSVHEFAEAQDARAHVELSIETGTPEERVAVFKGSRVPIQVVRRPVVRLIPKD